MSVSERVLNAIRARARLARGAQGQHTSLDDALLYTRHDAARKACESAVSITQTAGATAAQHRGSLEAAADQARLLEAREHDLDSAGKRLAETLERAKLLALNAALEGARLGEPAGKALVTVADEIRALVQRALEALDEQQGLLVQLEHERNKLEQLLEQARQRASVLADDLLHAQASQREARSALGELGLGLQRSTGTDPETARAVVQAADHARGLLTALTALSSRPQRGLVWRTLRPSIHPLLRLLGEIDRNARSRQSGS